MKVARRAGRCTAVSHKWKGGAKRCRAAHSRQSKPGYDFTHNDDQMGWELGLQAPNTNRQRPYPDATGVGTSSNKQLRKPD